jgi:DNA mismatch repair ATPase MutS
MKAMALNIIMAQAGMYTSATSFVYSPFKNMFTRVGNLDSYRYSSFQMECLDIRSIIRRSNEHTFILLDELTSSTEHLSALSISYALIKRLHAKRSTFMFATHLTELYDILMENPLDRVMIKHLDAIFDTDKGEIVFNRKLKDGYSKQLYGIEVAKSMLYDDKDFIEDAFSIREKLRPKFSHFNTKALMIRCDVCGSTDQLEEHHINHQAVADKDGVIKNEQGVFHKNTRGNLCCLCNACHQQHHHGSLKIIGWQTTSSGICLNYSKN